MTQEIFLIAALALLIGMMFFSSRKRKQQSEALMASIKVGSKVVLFSGITGKIVSIDGEHIVIESTPGTKLAVLRGAIRTAGSPQTSAVKKPAATKPAAKKPATKKPVAKKPAAKKPAAKKSSK